MGTSPLVAAVTGNLFWLSVLVILLLVVLGLAGYVALKRLKRLPEGAEASGDAVTLRVPDLGAPLRLRRSFVHALQQIETGVPGRDARYRMPWIFMLGESGVGKSALLAGSGLPKQMEEFSDPTAGCTWWFFAGGIVIDVAGHYVLDPQGQAGERGWRNVLRQLVQHRPERPADAIVLAIPSTDLTDPSNSESGYIAAKAERLYASLWAAQRTLGIRLPIYILVTKCNALPGFQPFAQALPDRLLDDMIGWSSPYPLDTVFSESWVDEAIETVHSDLLRLQLELFAARDRIEGVDEVFQLPHDLRRMSAPLAQYLRLLFRESAYHETFFLRGIYFTGDAGEAAAVMPPRAVVAVPSPVPALVTAGGQPVVTEPVPPWLRLPPIETAQRPRQQHVFLRHLFELKIFPEGGIARPAKGVALSQNRAIRATQVAIGATAAIGAVWLWLVAGELADFRRSAMPVLQSLPEDLRRARALKDEAVSVDAKLASTLDERMTLRLLRGISQLNFSWQIATLPSYWVSNFSRNIRRMIALSYSRIIIQSVHLSLDRQVDVIIGNAGQQADSTAAAATSAAVPRLQAYVAQLGDYERYVDKYNNLRETESLQDLADLVAYLFRFNVPAEFFSASYFYKRALGETEFPRVEISDDRPAAIAKFREVVRRGLIEGSGVDPVLVQTRDVTERLRTVLGQGRQGRGADIANFHDLARSLTLLERAVASDALAWLRGESPETSPAMRNLLADVASLRTLGPEVGEELTRTLAGQYASRRSELAQLTLPTLGPLLRQDGGRLAIELAAPVRQLHEELRVWGELPFMVGDIRPRDLRNIGRFTWDARALESGIGLAESYILFATNEVPRFPAPMQDVVRNLTLERLRLAMLDRVSQAQVPLGGTGSRLRSDDELRQEIAAFRDAAPVIQRMLQYFDQLQLAQGYELLAEVAVNHAVTMLAQADSLLNAEQLYLPQGGGFAWWTGSKPAAPEAFGVASSIDLPRYLGAQRQRIAGIARELAEPLANFLTGTTARGRGAGPLAAKWDAIVTVLADYDANRPNNSLALLEKFIATEMDEIDLTSCTAKLGPRVGVRSTDFFALRHAQLRQGMLEQCRILMDRTGSRAYGELAGAFNRNLAGRFPFVETGAQRVGDADIAQVRQFFQLYDERAKAVRESLGPRPQGSTASPAHDFFDRMDGVRTFFAGLLGPEGPGRSFVLDVDFRVNQGAEIGGRDIIEWQMEIGDQRIALGGGKKTITWLHGQPIVLAMRWARNGPSAPISDDAQPALRVDDRTALFVYEGPWALIDMMTRQALPPGEAATLADNRPHTLKLVVPTQANPGTVARPGLRLASRVYVRVAVKTLARGEGKPDVETALTLPQFPARAPDLR